MNSTLSLHYEDELAFLVLAGRAAGLNSKMGVLFQS